MKSSLLKLFIWFAAFLLLPVNQLIGQSYNQVLVNANDTTANLKIEVKNIKDKSFEVYLSVNWVNSDMITINNEKSMLVLEKEKMSISSSYIFCENFEKDDYIAFNKDYILTYNIKENFIGNKVTLNMVFDFASDPVRAGKINMREQFFLVQPKIIAIEIPLKKRNLQNIFPDISEIIKNHKPEMNSDVDLEITENNIQNPNRFALVIGNEDYSSYQANLNNEADVDYAIKDAIGFQEYAIRLLGIPERNVFILLDATAVKMNESINKLIMLSNAKEGQAELFFYYAGHGLPDENTKDAYIMPVDVSGSSITLGIKLDELYSKLGSCNAKCVTVFLDACFSGGSRNKPLTDFRAVKIKPKENLLIKGNIVIFSSSSGDETSAPYKEKKHGLFTYFLLKKLHETKAILSYKELYDYLLTTIKVESVFINSKPQTPQINLSQEANQKWESYSF